MNKKLKREVLKLSTGVEAMRVELASYHELYPADRIDDTGIYIRIDHATTLLAEYYEEARKLLGRVRRSQTMSRKIAEGQYGAS